MEQKRLELPAIAYRYVSKKYYHWHGLMVSLSRQDLLGEWRMQQEALTSIRNGLTERRVY